MIKKKAFTLVELILVIVIIGVLAAISIIGYANQAVNARNNAAFTGLSEAVRAANVCLAADEILFVIASGEVVAGKSVCQSTTAVNGNWPDLTKVGGDWKYAKIGNAPVDQPLGWTGGESKNQVGQPPNVDDLQVSGANTTKPNGYVRANDPTVSCSISGCKKWNFK